MPPPAPADDPRILAQDFDLQHLTPAFYADPYPVYRALRTYEPVKRMPDGSLFLTRYRDVQAVYRDPKTFSSDKTVEFKPKYGESPLYAHHTTSLVFNDPPLHTRVRKLIAGALTARAIAAMEPGLIRLVDGLLDAAAAQGRIDLISEFAAAIPLEIIGNLLVVPHEERAPLREWSLAILGALEPALNEAQLERGNRAVSEFVAYLQDLVTRRRRSPGDPQHDVLTRLIEGKVDGERLSEAELLQNCIFILNAGHETTTNLIGNGMLALGRNPGAIAALRSKPDLMRGAIEEMLRYDGPVQATFRTATRDTTIGGTPITAGMFVFVITAAANRDPAKFKDPEKFDITRESNEHMAFGDGIHFCIGALLARMEGSIAIGAALERFPHLRLKNPDAPLTYKGSYFLRGLSRLDMAVK